MDTAVAVAIETKSKPSSKRRLFVSYSWGAAGSTWLARALNAHADIFAIHRPRFDDEGPDDIADAARRLNSLFTSRSMGGVYPIVGVTHGVHTEAHDELTAMFSGRFAPFTVVRHPVLRVESHRALLAKTDSNERSDRDRFRQSTKALNRVINEVSMNIPIHRVEDLSTRVDAFQALVDYLSNSTVEFEPTRLAQLQAERVGSHRSNSASVQEVIDSWPTAWRRDFNRILEPRAIDIYGQLGYVVPTSPR